MSILSTITTTILLMDRYCWCDLFIRENYNNLRQSPADYGDTKRDNIRIASTGMKNTENEMQQNSLLNREITSINIKRGVSWITSRFLWYSRNYEQYFATFYNISLQLEMQRSSNFETFRKTRYAFITVFKLYS